MAMLGSLGGFGVAAFCWWMGGVVAQYESCNGNSTDIGNGRCDAALNVPSCGYDGGDCCPCTCSDGPDHSCLDNNFDCIYPGCGLDETAGTEEVLCVEEGQGDGWCQDVNNHAGCNWDGGDCCECTCQSTSDDWACGTRERYDGYVYGDDYVFGSRGPPSHTESISWDFPGFDCKDPACYEPETVAKFPDCTGNWRKIGDGVCTEENNNAACGYDGGDCCLCTCSGVACGSSYWDCLDPDSPDGQFNCEAPPPDALPCSAGVQRAWVVENSAQARAMTTAVYCSGGSFEVEWIGVVVVDEPIYVVDGTVLTVSGTASDTAPYRFAAVIYGNGSTQAFVVANATLHVSGIAMYDGSGLNGGAVGASSGSSLTFDNTTFGWNSASGNGGAVFLSENSSMSCVDCWFESNAADGNGGAIFLGSGSSVSCTGVTRFIWNFALEGRGGAIHATNSKASWEHAVFYLNSAKAGGALYLASSEVSWSGNNLFEACFTYSYTGGGGGGGAILLMNGSSLTYAGKTDFMGNNASTDGGAIVSPALDTINNPRESTLTIDGITTFFGNRCGANGGGMALLGACSIVITENAAVNFTENAAGVAGGAVYVSSSGLGPTFPRVSFVSNEAQIGGAASITGSGNTKDANVATPPNPTTFDSCYFIANRATAAGGAVESAAGHDAMFDSLFHGNTARVGGALRLAGSAVLHRCSFVENMSEDGEGAAVSNIGVISALENNSFLGNIFNCPRDTFLNSTLSDRPLEVVCDGCDIPCNVCSFDLPPLVPMCSDVMEHANSSGGRVTLEELWIAPGYWRATQTSMDILTCYNANACLGGVTGAPGYCLEGHEGPYCTICSNGYSPQLGFTCNDCSNSVGGIVLATFFLAVGLFVVAVVISYLMSEEDPTKRPGVIQRMVRYIPLQSVKVIIVAWQILTQFASVANITYPDVYQRFLGVLDIINFDIGLVFSLGCLFEMDFHDRLLISTLCPIVVIGFLIGAYGVAALLGQLQPQFLQVLWNKIVSLVLLVTFLVYSSASSVLFKAFACDDLADGKYYLRADYRIECDSPKHENFQVYAGFMIAVYAIGIPALYGFLLFKDRRVLEKDEAGRAEAAETSPISDLWRPYKPSAYYYEVVECARRILLAGVVVFIYPNTAAQIAVTLMMAFAFVVISEVLSPYVSRWDTWISRMGHIVVFVSMFVALLLKVDVSEERAVSQKVFGVVLISVHVCMVAVVVVETFFVAASIRAERREEREFNSSRLSMKDSQGSVNGSFDRRNPYPGLPRIFH